MDRTTTASVAALRRLQKQQFGEAIEKGLADAQAGRFVTDEELKATFARFGSSRERERSRDQEQG